MRSSEFFIREHVNAHIEMVRTASCRLRRSKSRDVPKSPRIKCDIEADPDPKNLTI